MKHQHRPAKLSPKHDPEIDHKHDPAHLVIPSTNLQSLCWSCEDTPCKTEKGHGLRSCVGLVGGATPPQSTKKTRRQLVPRITSIARPACREGPGKNALQGLRVLKTRGKIKNVSEALSRRPRKERGQSGWRFPAPFSRPPRPPQIAGARPAHQLPRKISPADRF